VILYFSYFIFIYYLTIDIILLIFFKGFNSLKGCLEHFNNQSPTKNIVFYIYLKTKIIFKIKLVIPTI